MKKSTRMKEMGRGKEKDFDLSSSPVVPRIPPYNALVDPNMCHFFENRNIQELLMKTGQIDYSGRVMEHERNKFKLTILEKEFARAEEQQRRRLDEENMIRYRIQRKRIIELENSRKLALIGRVKREKEFSREILSTARFSAEMMSKTTSPHKTSSTF